MVQLQFIPKLTNTAETLTGWSNTNADLVEYIVARQGHPPLLNDILEKLPTLELTAQEQRGEPVIGSWDPTQSNAKD